MNCDRVGDLLSAYADGETGRLQGWRIRRHLRGCAACAAQHQQLLAMRAQVRAQAPRFSAPAQLRARVQTLLADAPAGVPAAGARAKPDRWRWLAAGALAGCTATLLLMLAGSKLLEWRLRENIVEEIVAMHVHATLTEHRIEVASSDQHTVKPWLSARLDYSPPVPDLASSGFALIGARLDSVQGRPVATLVYRFRQHWIDVFVRPEPAASPSGPATVRGFHVVHAQSAGWDWLAVSDVNEDVLTSFVQQVARTAPAPE